MSWWAWLLVAGTCATMGHGLVELARTSVWLRRNRRTFERMQLRRWLRFHGGLR